MKKVVIFNACLERGGAERVTVYLAKYLVAHHISCDIVTYRMGKNEYDVPDGVQRTCLSSSKKTTQILELRSILKKLSPDIVLIMGVSNASFVIPAVAGLKIKVVVSERNDPNHPTGKKLVNSIARLLMKYAHGFIFQTEDAKAFYAKKLNGRGTVIFNPLPVETLPHPYFGERQKMIVSAGRLAPQKNQKMLITAFSKIANQYPDYNLTIYGEGALRQFLEQQISDLGLQERVFLPGNITDLHTQIKTSAFFVMSSDFEGMPNALIEAMALGLPCISTDCPCGGPKTLIREKENGLLIEVGDSDALADAMATLIENQSLAFEMGQNAVAIRDRLSMEMIGKEWVAYFTDVFQSKG